MKIRPSELGHLASCLADGLRRKFPIAGLRSDPPTTEDYRTSKWRAVSLELETEDLAIHESRFLKGTISINGVAVVPDVAGDFGLIAAIGLLRRSLASLREHCQWDSESVAIAPLDPRLIDMLDEAAQDLAAAEWVPSHAQRMEGGPDVPPDAATVAPWDAATEARNKWIYEQAMQGTALKAIVSALEKKSKSKGWELVTTVQAVRKISRRYAEVHNLPLPKERQRGRRKS